MSTNFSRISQTDDQKACGVSTKVSFATATRLTPDVIKHRQSAPTDRAAKTNIARGAQPKRAVVIDPEGGNQCDRNRNDPKVWP
jgi:hypothetical protein